MSKQIEKAAEILRNASQTKEGCAPIRELIGIEDLETAYAIQKINNDLLIKNGARVVGKKIGLTSKTVQKQLGVDQPDYGILLNTMEVQNGGNCPMDQLMQPKVEAEIAFVLGKDLRSTSITAVEMMDAIAYALPSIEIVGSRVEKWNIKITDTIADNASASHFVLGHTPTRLSDFDVVNCQMEMTVNGEIASTGDGRSCLGSPINACIWLAEQMAKLGTPLLAGEIILSGALGPMVAIQGGEKVKASFSGLGSVEISFG